MTHRTIATMQTVKDADALVELLHKLNEAGEWPNLPFVDQQGIAGVAYGIDAGDEMAVAYLSDPGEDRLRSDGHDHDGTESYIALFEGDVYELHGPIVVLVPGSSEPSPGEADG